MLDIVNYVVVMLIFIVGYFLFSLKNEVNNLNYQLIQVNKQIKEEIDNINVIKAELSHLISPDKLRKLSSSYLILQNIHTSQMTADLLLNKKKVIYDNYKLEKPLRSNIDQEKGIKKWRYKKLKIK